MQDYYKILGIPNTATASEIKEAYRKAAKHYHPDANSAPNAAYMFSMINEAYEALSKGKTNQAYEEEQTQKQPQRQKHRQPQEKKPKQQKPKRQSTGRLPLIIRIPLKILSIPLLIFLKVFIFAGGLVASFGTLVMYAASGICGIIFIIMLYSAIFGNGITNGVIGDIVMISIMGILTWLFMPDGVIQKLVDFIFDKLEDLQDWLKEL